MKAKKTHRLKCKHCKSVFYAQRIDAKFCSTSCRVSAGNMKVRKVDDDPVFQHFIAHTPFVIAASYGNDSVATIQWCYESGMNPDNVICMHTETGWCKQGWIEERIEPAEAWARSLGFKTHRLIPPMGFAELMRHKGCFPMFGRQWCALYLKILPSDEWLDTWDTERKAVVITGVRKMESQKRKERTFEFREVGEFQTRMVWQPLYMLDNAQRDKLALKSGLPLLNSRSPDCSPCILSSFRALAELEEVDIRKAEQLEKEVGQPFFSPQKFGGAQNIRDAIEFAKQSRESRADSLGCDSAFSCGL